MTTGVVQPDLAGYQLLAAERPVVAVTRRLLADGETPVGVYRKLAGGPGTFLLESAEHGRAWSRYSFIGVRAAATLTERDGQAVWLGDPGHAQMRHDQPFQRPAQRPSRQLRTRIRRGRRGLAPDVPAAATSVAPDGDLEHAGAHDPIEANAVVRERRDLEALDHRAKGQVAMHGCRGVRWHDFSVALDMRVVVNDRGARQANDATTSTYG